MFEPRHLRDALHVVRRKTGGFRISESFQLGAGTVTSVQIQNATIQNANIADLTVAGQKIQPGAISNAAFTNSIGVKNGGNKTLGFALTVPDASTVVQLIFRVYMVGNTSWNSGGGAGNGGGEGNGGA